MRRTVAVYAGSFDPPTRGHLDMIARAARLFDKLIVSVGVHPTRRPLFSADERIALLRALVLELGEGVEISSFSGLLVEHCKQQGANVIVRGLRSAVDFDYEMQLAYGNHDQDAAIETVFLPTRHEHSFVSASLAREIASHGGNLDRYVVPVVADALRAKFATDGK